MKRFFIPITILSLFGVFFFTPIVQAQTPVPKTNMTPAELESFIETIASKPRPTRRRTARKKRIIYYPYPGSYRSSASSDIAQVLTQQDWSRRMAAVEKRLAMLENQSGSTNPTADDIAAMEATRQELLAELQSLRTISTTSKDTIQIVTSPQTSVLPDSQQIVLLQTMVRQLDMIQAQLDSRPQETTTAPASNELAYLYQRIDSLQQQLNAIPKVVPTQPSSRDADYDKLLAKVELLEQKLAQHDHPRPSSPVVVAPPTIVDDLPSALRGNETKTIYFENGSSMLSNTAQTTINDIAQWLRNYDRLDVMVTGFTSQRGTALMNQALSQDRAEAVKRALMNLGIHADRIFSTYHGIDYSAPEDKARRVEIKILVRQKRP